MLRSTFASNALFESFCQTSQLPPQLCFWFSTHAASEHFFSVMEPTTFASSVSFNTREGIVECTFMPPVTPTEYTEIYRLLRLPLTCEALLNRLRGCADRWGITMAVAHWSLCKQPAQ